VILVRRVAARLGVDIAYITTIVVFSYGLFLRTWDLWADQAVFQYMAWGIHHGLRPYRDTINMNWPGCLLVHLLGEAFTGMDASGLRLVETGFLWTLCVATAVILRAYGVGIFLRIAAVTFFLVAYFGTGYQATAMRESFMTPCLAVGLIPLLTATPRTDGRDRAAWIVAGAFAGFGFWIKPTIVLPLAGAVATAFLFARSRRLLWSRLGAYLTGAAVVSVAVLAFVAIWADLAGFWRWGVEFTFGAYAWLRWPHEVRVRHLVHSLGEPGNAPTLWLCLAGVGAFAVLLGLLAKGKAQLEWVDTARRTFNLWLLVVLVVATIYIQGKTHSVYQYIPLKWSMALFGALLCGHALPARLRRPLRPRPRWRGPVRWGAFVVGVAFYSLYAMDFSRADTGRGETGFTDTLQSGLGDKGEKDTVVVFGFMGPSVLCTLERVTPFPFIDGWSNWTGAPEGSPFRAEYVRLWEKALSDPSVRFFIAQRGTRLPPGLRFDESRDELSEDVVARYFPEPKLRSLGFVRSKAFDAFSSWVDVYERAR
jgi:hypothetical protein